MTSRGLDEKAKAEGRLDKMQSLSSRHNISEKDTTLSTRRHSHVLHLDFHSIKSCIQMPCQLTGMTQIEHADVHNSNRQSPLV